MSMASSQTERLPLHDKHVSRNARLGQFGEWEVPLYYRGILEEHEAVRTRAGLFDISHMGKFEVSGPSCASVLDSILPRPIAAMKETKALYMPLLNDEAGILDDIIVYRIAAERFFIIVNASNVDKDRTWLKARLEGKANFKDLTRDRCLVALQGPESPKVLAKILGKNDFESLGYYHFALWEDGMIARTGYTGEDGYEIMASKALIEKLWDSLLAAGVEPVGFGARDTLRLEAGMPLYGHDLNEGVTPLEAGIGWAVDLTKPAFPGKKVLESRKAAGVRTKLVGFEMAERGIPRPDFEVRKNGIRIGRVASGSFAPTLKKNIGMAYVDYAYAQAGAEFEIVIRDKEVKARIVPLPFYKRQK